jgi:ferredoxin-thioredoxin reductase catalytic subunit
VSDETAIPRKRVLELRDELEKDAQQNGYHLNPDRDFTADLAEGLLVNESRFGYRSCPCRLASGTASEDLDIVCPCDYRDADLAEWGACYCALYVSQEVVDGERELTAVPERRPPGGPGVDVSPKGTAPTVRPGVTVWRCRVCGYLCGREEPPEKCPICKASKERFEKFWE